MKMNTTLRVVAWVAPAVLVLVACSGSDSGHADVVGADAVGADAVADVPVVSSRGLVCNQVMGVSVTGDWYVSGFESIVEDGRWQVVSEAHAYIDLWTDPASAEWAIAPVSPCTANAGDPDRVLFTGCNWAYTTAQEWTTAFTAVVEDLKAKYPNLKRVDLLTMLRAPGNVPCGDGGSLETVVQPWIDEAIANVVAAYPGFVTAAPKFEAPSCDVFSFGGPHFTIDGRAVIAKMYGDYYANEP